MSGKKIDGVAALRSKVRCSLAVAAVAPTLLAACGSRSPLSIDGNQGAPSAVVVDAGEDVAPLAFCVNESRLIGEIPIDLYFVMDRSMSMTTIVAGSMLSRWNAVAMALKGLLQSPMSAGLGAGIGFFPRGAGDPLCTSADYFFPVVPIGTLGGAGVAAANIAAAIDAESPSGMGTPTTPALDGAHKYARSQQATHGDRVAAVVMVTDGQPRNCGSTIPLTSAIAAAALTGAPPIKTYVLGVGPNLSNLNAIAQAGGTGEAYLVEAGGEGAFTVALETIRTSALTCEYVIPEQDGKPPDLTKAGVWTRTGADGARDAIGQVANAQACADGPGWFYDHPVTSNGPAPTKITLCPASCDPVVHADNSHLDVSLGCDAPDGS